ncbi:MAG: TIGR02757 family protein [Bacteroidia bacterium]
MAVLNKEQLHDFLETAYDKYNRPEFITSDPISIPHLFTKKEDIEISAFLAATIAWGQRTTIINNAKKLVEAMDLSPYDFVMEANNKELQRLEHFKHRTFNAEDLAFFILSLRNIYTQHGGMEKVFSKEDHIKDALVHFNNVFFSILHPKRTEKHVSNPAAGSASKRLNMFLRWMVRNDKRGVDFGIWKSISPDLLYCPLDVHSGNVARKLKLLKRKQNDWQTTEELTKALRKFDAKDPVKYDFALFGLGVFEKF